MNIATIATKSIIFIYLWMAKWVTMKAVQNVPSATKQSNKAACMKKPLGNTGLSIHEVLLLD